MSLGDIILNKNVCDTILEKNGLVSEVIEAKYCTDYRNGIIISNGRMNIKIAYAKGARPIWADKCPSLEDITDYVYDNVVKQIITSKFLEFLTTY